MTRPAEYIAPCFGACPDLPMTLHREVRLVKVLEPGEGPAYGRKVIVQCCRCNKFHELLRPPDEEGKRKLHDYRHEKGLGHEHRGTPSQDAP